MEFGITETKILKRLACGDVNGKFKTLFTRVESINKKNGPFSYVLCVGNFFGSDDSSSKQWEPYASGKLNVPVPMYVLGGNNETHIKYFAEADDSGQIAPNVTYLGKRGVVKTTSGLKIAYISGVEQSGNEKSSITFTPSDVTHVRDMCIAGQPSFQGVDFLLTSFWPQNITRLDPKSIDNAPPGSQLLSWLAVQLKPRYHICGLEGIYYERPPYCNVSSGSDTGVHCTRFIALAGVGNKENKKWLVALSVTPIEKMKLFELYQQTTDQTALPYIGSAMSARCNDEEQSTTQFFYDMSSPTSPKRGSKRKHDGSHRKSREKPSFDQDKCWFCLASPDVEKHLIISIGTEVYLALAKGGLVDDHLLICTVGHYQSTSCLPDNIIDEIEKFKSALRKYFLSKNAVPVFFERNYKTSHLQIQVVPVPRDKASGLSIIFQEQAEMEGFELQELPQNAELGQIAPPGTPYFYVELPTNKFFHRVTKNFPIQFGREVVACASVLDMEERADWRACKMSIEDETQLCQSFRKKFEPFDFTL